MQPHSSYPFSCCGTSADVTFIQGDWQPFTCPFSHLWTFPIYTLMSRFETLRTPFIHSNRISEEFLTPNMHTNHLATHCTPFIYTDHLVNFLGPNMHTSCLTVSKGHALTLRDFHTLTRSPFMHTGRPTQVPMPLQPSPFVMDAPCILHMPYLHGL